MSKFELTKADKALANEAYKTPAYLERFRRIKVTYLDGKSVKYTIDNWLLHRDNIRKNLFEKGLCKIKPIKKIKIFGYAI